MFKTSGVISGGSSDLRTKARCWDEKDMLRLKERKDQLFLELRVSKVLKPHEYNCLDFLKNNESLDLMFNYLLKTRVVFFTGFDKGKKEGG